MDSKKTVNEDVMLEVGKTLQLEKYRIEELLSSGGFGNTYVVTNIQFEERRAMKEFFMKGINERDDNATTISVSNKANRPQFEAQREKFKKEARRLRKLSHPNIVGVDDLFDENGTTYYVMDYVEGGSLSERVKRGETFSEAQVRKLLPPLLSALEYVHNQQMWHLDLKPGNILLDTNGNPILIDFGASKQMGLSGGDSTSTAMTYTPGYAPSEQVDQNFDRIGPWTDLYALGGTLYYLLTRETPPSVSEIQEGDAFHFTYSVSEQMRSLIVWLMNPNRRRRPQSVAEVRAYLNDQQTATSESVVGDDTVLGGKKPTSQKIPQPAPEEHPVALPWWQRMTAIHWTIISLAVVACIIWAFIGIHNLETDEPVKTQIISDTILPTIVTAKSFTSDLGVYTYTGPVDAEGNPDGTGEATFNDGRSYKGPFTHGKFEGTDATFVFANGDVFTGEFRNNLFYRGRISIKEDGSYFEGSFTDGQPDKGSWYDKNNRKLQ